MVNDSRTKIVQPSSLGPNWEGSAPGKRQNVNEALHLPVVQADPWCSACKSPRRRIWPFAAALAVGFVLGIYAAAEIGSGTFARWLA